MSDRQPREEPLRVDPAFLEKYEAPETTVHAVSEPRTGKDDGEQKPGEVWKRGAGCGWKIGRNVGAVSSASRAFVALSKLFLGRRRAAERARARQRLRKHFGRGEIMRNSGNARLEVGQRTAAGRRGEKSYGAKLGFSDGLAFSHRHHNKAGSLLFFKP